MSGMKRPSALAALPAPAVHIGIELDRALVPDVAENVRMSSLLVPPCIRLVSDLLHQLHRHFALPMSPLVLQVGGFTLLPAHNIADVLRDGDRIHVRRAVRDWGPVDSQDLSLSSTATAQTFGWCGAQHTKGATSTRGVHPRGMLAIGHGDPCAIAADMSSAVSIMHGQHKRLKLQPRELVTFAGFSDCERRQRQCTEGGLIAHADLVVCRQLSQEPPQAQDVETERQTREEQGRATRAQMEYYFSDRNYWQDRFLQQQADNLGWTSLKFVSRFNRMRELTDDLDLVRSSLVASEVVELSECGHWIRRRNRSSRHHNAGMRRVDSIP